MQKEDKIDKAQFYITSLQDDQSEIALSSGNISLDMLRGHENLEAQGIPITETFAETSLTIVLIAIAVVVALLLVLSLLVVSHKSLYKD